MGLRNTTSSGFRGSLKLALSSVGILAALVFIACATGSSPEGDDPPGFVCEYDPTPPPGASPALPTLESLGEFDYFVRVRVTGHRQETPQSEIVNLATVEEALSGPVATGDRLEIPDSHVCLETGMEYYLLLDRPEGSQHLRIKSPQAQFPVINNRITLHPLMRQDELVGRFHGLDPVLFKRRFTEFTGRTDIEVG